MRVSESQTFRIIVWRNGSEFHAQFFGRAEAGSITDIALALGGSLYPPGARLFVDMVKFETTDEVDRLLAELAQAAADNMVVARTEEPLTAALIEINDKVKSPAVVGRPWWQMHSYDLPPDRWVCGFARARTHELALSAGLTPHETDDFILAVGEAVTNAIRHGCADDTQSRIRLRCVAGPDAIEINVTDTGPGFDPQLLQPADRPTCAGGHGLGIMNTTVDKVVYSREGGMSIRLVKYLKRRDSTGD